MKRYDSNSYYGNLGMKIDREGEYVLYEDAARILAQRDRLAECLKMARNWIHDRDGDTRIYDAVLAELDKERQQ